MQAAELPLAESDRSSGVSLAGARPRVAVVHKKFEKAWPVGERSEYEILDIEEALHRVYETDAHLVTYIVTTPATHQPRLLKSSLAKYPLPVTTNVLFCDVDNVAHADWTPELLATLDGILQTEGLYLTRRGYRLIQPLTEPVATGEVEPVLFAWLTSLAARGIAVDWGCRDWTRHFRLPHVQRDGRPYASPRVDLTQMRAIHIEPAMLPIQAPRKPASKRAALAAPESFASTLPEPWPARARRIADAVRHEPDDWHALFLALSGALLERATQAMLLPALVRAISVETHADTATADREKSARSTIALRVGGSIVAGYGTLRRRWPRVADAVDAAFYVAPIAGPSAVVVMPPRREGVQVLAAECGMGKTYAALGLAEERSRILHKDPDAEGKRAPAGSKTSISVDKNSLAIQIANDLRARGVPVRRLFGPLSVEGDGACKMKSYAEPLSRGGQSVAIEFCEGRHRERCPHYTTCTARLAGEGDSNARVTVGPHALLGLLDAARGTRGLLIVDEPPGVLENIEITKADFELALKHVDSFETAYGERLRPILEALRAWAEHGIEPDMAAMRERLPEDKVPPLRWTAIHQARGHVVMARVLGLASRVCRDVLRALRDESAALCVELSKVMLSVPHTQLVPAMRSGEVILMAADAEMHLPLYERAVDYSPPFTRFAAPDGAPIARTMFRMRASRTAWASKTGGEASFERALKRALQWADGASVGIVTFLRFEATLVAAIAKLGYTGEVRTAHFGGTRGLDHWKDLDALVTLGDPRPNGGAVEREAAWARIPWEVRVNQLAAAELEQCHGRLRTVHRTKPGKALHVGSIRPGGLGWAREDVDVVEDEGGRPVESVVGAEALREDVERYGKDVVAARLGMTVRGLNMRLRQNS